MSHVLQRVEASFGIKRTDADSGKRPHALAHLAGHVPDDLLIAAVCEAERIGATADRVLIAQGAISDARAMDLLACELGALRADGSERFDPELDWRRALHARAARLATGDWLIAPEGAAVAALRRHVAPGGAQGRVRLATAQEFEQAVIGRFGPAVARAAAEDLPERDPRLSAKGGFSSGQIRALAALATLLGVGLFGGAVAWLTLCGLFSLAMMIAVAAKLAAAAMSGGPIAAETLLGDEQTPAASVLVPLYREANVVPQLVAALGALDYPAAKLEILFLVECDDAATLAALRAQDLPPFARVCVVPDGEPRTKPRALNVGLMLARGELLVIYDAEDRPEPDQLRKAASAFAVLPENVACLQASLAIHNAADSWLTRLFALDYAAQFDVVLRGFGALALPAPLGGTSNHFRVDALRRVGGWDAWNVTEDADLGLRLARMGYRTASLASTTWEEAPPDWRDWFPQRRRWIKGWLQTLVTHLRDPAQLLADLGPGPAAHVACLLISNALGPLVGVWFTGLVAWGWFARGVVDLQATLFEQALALGFAGLACAGVVAMLVPTTLGAARRGLWTCLPWLALRPAHWVLLSLAALAAIGELRSRPFQWAKTRHGLARPRPAAAFRASLTESAGSPARPSRAAIAD